MKGFTFPFKFCDVFVETTRTKKNHTLASKIIRQLVNKGYDIPDNPDVRSEILSYLRKAECEIHTLPSGKKYYEIHGDGFGGRGSLVGDGRTLIIKL